MPIVGAEEGILVAGKVIPGTERVVRDPHGWWKPGSPDTRARKGSPIDLIVGHWTAGPRRTGLTSGSTLVKAMDSRRNKDGNDLSVSVHFSISWDGIVFQHADLDIATVHIGFSPAIVRSIGVEVMSPGTVTMAKKLKLPYTAVTKTWDGSKIQAVAFSSEQEEAWKWLTRTLATYFQIPYLPAPRTRFTPKQMAAFKGICEHANIPLSKKTDAAGLLLDLIVP